MKMILNLQEVNYLISFIGDIELFSIPVVDDDKEAMSSLVDKGLINRDGKPNTKTVFIVEMLRAFNHASIYFHFQDFVFALIDEETCIINKKIYQDDTTYNQFMIGDYKMIWNIILNHPIIKQQHNNEVYEIGDCNLIIELFNKTKQLLGEVKVEIDNNEWYLLNDELKRESKIEELDIMQIVLELLPSKMASVLKGEIINGQIIQ